MPVAIRGGQQMTRYLILHANKPFDESLDFSKAAAWRDRERAPTDLTVETVEEHEKNVGKLRADPKNAAVVDAGVMMSLIKPTAKSTGGTAALKHAGALQMPEGLLAVGAHTSPFSGQGVTVAVLDTGIDETHPAFKGKTIVKRDFTGEGTSREDVRDLDGHGTHCAGTLCGGKVNDIRVGVAPGVTKLCVGKVLGSKGCTLEMIINGMYWAVFQEKAVVVSLSLGYDLPGNTKRLEQMGWKTELASMHTLRQQSEIIEAISKLRSFLESQSPNVVFTAASGNESARPEFVLDAGLPAKELFPVGAVGVVGPAGDKWQVADFSNGRAQIVAPGVDVFSAAVGGAWATMSGTSMATPHVAGVAALWVEKLRNDGMMNVSDAVRSQLKTSAKRQPLVTEDLDAIGAGLVQSPQN